MKKLPGLAVFGLGVSLVGIIVSVFNPSSLLSPFVLAVSIVLGIVITMVACLGYNEPDTR